MRDIAWRMGFTVMALLGLMRLAPNLRFGTAPYQLEKALGRTPQALVTHYLTAVAQGNLGTATALWQEADGSLEAAGAPMTEELARYGAGMQHRVVDVSWWRTCCEAVAIDDPDTADVATIRVAISGEEQRAQIYIFETRAVGGPWGGSASPSFRDWAITGAHLERQASEVQAWR